MASNTSAYEELKGKWSNKHRSLQETLWNKHKDAMSFLYSNTQHFAVSSLGSLVLLSTPIYPLLSPPTPASLSASIIQDLDSRTFLISDLYSILPNDMRALTQDEEKKVEEVLSRHFSLSAKVHLEGKRLNRSYGLIGAEQHLMRYPGDTITTHFVNNQEAVLFARSGMAPGRGAWGYFTSSVSELNEKDILREKYYIAVQTFLSDSYYTRVGEYSKFFKYRKMLVVNPNNGKAIVVVIGDAGPAVWTGKHLGGSPEVMQHLERVDGARRGGVLYFFIDDPEDKISLGPIEPL